MTKSEKRQPLSIFISAGRKAFQIGTDPVNNPYRQEPYRNAWTKGFFDEMNVSEVVRPAHGARPTARRKYSAAHTRLPYGDRLPEKQNKRYVRHRAEATFNDVLSYEGYNF